jgi:hypothetical protein
MPKLNMGSANTPMGRGLVADREHPTRRGRACRRAADFLSVEARIMGMLGIEVRRSRNATKH